MVGVMIRDGLAPDAIYVGIFVTPQNTVNLQYRTTKGQQTQQGVPISITTPCWVRIERVNNNFTVASSGDGTSWHAFSQVSLNMPSGMLIGVALTSHDANQFATTHVDSLTVSQK
jgi:regulation of enolase protein 1 (concanavalin A-like superfamily)